MPVMASVLALVLVDQITRRRRVVAMPSRSDAHPRLLQGVGVDDDVLRSLSEMRLRSFEEPPAGRGIPKAAKVT